MSRWHKMLMDIGGHSAIDVQFVHNVQKPIKANLSEQFEHFEHASKRNLRTPISYF